jgi:hypothetical protein
MNGYLLLDPADKSKNERDDVGVFDRAGDLGFEEKPLAACHVWFHEHNEM